MFDLAEPIPGPSTELLGKVARDKGVGRRRVAVRAARGRAVPQHRRRPRRRRQRCSGSTARCTSPTIRSTTRSITSRRAISASARFDTKFGRIGTLVCWDQWYPEGARLTALQGAEVLFYPTAIGWHPKEKAQYGHAQASAWETMQRAHAIANGVFVAAVNRVGHEGPAGRRPRVLGRLVRLPTRSASSSEGRAATRRSWSSSAIARGSRTCGATGRSCATAASTPTADHERFLDGKDD